MDESHLNKSGSNKLSPLIHELLVDVFMFHWKGTAVGFSAIIVVLGWFAGDLVKSSDWRNEFEVYNPMSYFLLASAILVSIILVWRTFTSITLWRLNCIAMEHDSQYSKFVEDKIRFTYNGIAAFFVELPLFGYNALVLLGYGWKAFPFSLRLWTGLYFVTVLMCGLCFCIWLARHIQIRKWDKERKKEMEKKEKDNLESKKTT
jgi:hypothetical protein